MSVYTYLACLFALILSGCCQLDPEQAFCVPDDGPPAGCVSMSAMTDDDCQGFCERRGEADSCLYGARDCFCGACCE